MDVCPYIGKMPAFRHQVSGLKNAESSSPGEIHPQALTGGVEDWRGTQKARFQSVAKIVAKIPLTQNIFFAILAHSKISSYQFFA